MFYLPNSHIATLCYDNSTVVGYWTASVNECLE